MKYYKINHFCRGKENQEMKTYFGIFCIIQLLAFGLANTENNGNAYSLPITFPKGENLSDIPMLSGIAVDITQKIQASKTPIQRSSEAFALELFRVSLL